jgi:dissimilatory sulfite reductase related protein
MASVDLLDREETAANLKRIEETLERLAMAVDALDARRQELDELVTDLAPALNGALAMAIRRLDALERGGGLAFVRETAAGLERVATTVDPAEIRALADSAGTGLRTLRALAAPEVGALAERSVQAMRESRTGPPPQWRELIRALREPRVRRGLAALIRILRALGDTPPAAARPASIPRAMSRARPHTSSPAAAPASPRAAPSASVRVIAATPVQMDAEGFMTDRNVWTPEIAAELAAEAGLSLSDRHWQVIEFCRTDAGESGPAPGLRRIARGLGTSAAELYALFPRGPGLAAARMAGLPKPKSCV